MADLSCLAVFDLGQWGKQQLECGLHGVGTFHLGGGEAHEVGLQRGKPGRGQSKGGMGYYLTALDAYDRC